MIESSAACIVCTSSIGLQAKKAAELSEKLSLPLCNTIDNNYKYHLVYTDYRLELQYNPHLHKYKHRSVSVDFLDGHNNIIRRILTTNTKSPLAKAVGIKPGYRPTVVDATAGLGMDGLTLGWLGCRVILIERSRLVHALLNDGLQRAVKNKQLKKIIDEKITLLRGDTRTILSTLTKSIDTILLDPMYPKKKKGALNKKEMRLLRDIVGDDNDGSELFPPSFVLAKKRVVIKRPKGAKEIITSPQPSHRMEMKSGRFDIYYIHPEPSL